MRETMVSTTMRQRSITDDWQSVPKRKSASGVRLKRNALFFSAVLLCAVGGTLFATKGTDAVQYVMAHVTAGFEFDESIGRLHYVRNVLPESVMVFLTSNEDALTVWQPSETEACHVWTEQEPWIEYRSDGKVMNACEEGEVMSIVRNNADKYTLRIRHENGYESVYSGISALKVSEGERIHAGDTLGSCASVGAFELRHDGLSVLPVFR